MPYTSYVKLVGQTTITTIEEPDHLQFVTTRVRGWTDLLLPTILTVVGGGALGFKHFFMGALCLLAAILFLANFSKPSTNQLDVSQSEMIVRSSVDSSISQDKTVKSPEMKSLGYQYGNKNQPSGLYANQGIFNQICLLPGLSKQQANEIADTICKKFPNYRR